MAAQRILVVDDDRGVRDLLKRCLMREGFGVACVDTGEKALDMALEGSFEGIILDIILPGIDGFDVLKRLKSHPRTRPVPVILLSGRVEDADVVTGLELGAEDYVTKPFSVLVLISRLKAVIRRHKLNAGEPVCVIRIQDIRIHPGRCEVVAGEQKISLTPSEFAILHLLAQRPGWVLTRSQIISSLRGSDATVQDRSVDYLVASLRKKLGRHADKIETVRGFGYRVMQHAGEAEMN